MFTSRGPWTFTMVQTVLQMLHARRSEAFTPTRAATTRPDSAQWSIICPVSETQLQQRAGTQEESTLICSTNKSKHTVATCQQTNHQIENENAANQAPGKPGTGVNKACGHKIQKHCAPTHTHTHTHTHEQQTAQQCYSATNESSRIQT